MNIAQLVGRALRPPERVAPSQWADNNRVLPATSSEAGRWRTDRTPYMLEIMDCMTPGHEVREIALMMSAQVGKTELINNTIGHAMDVYPAPMLIVQPTEDTARSWSEKKLRPMIESTPALRDLFGPSQKNPRNKTMYKEFPGGFLRIAYSSSAVQLRSDAIRDVLLDEVDGFPENVDGEGDPVELAIARTRTFSDRRRILGVSTPTIKGHSRIERWYYEGDQRKYYLACPHCDERFVLEFAMLQRTPDGVQCQCPACQQLIDEAHKTQMLAGGEWRATADHDVDPRTRSYHLSALYSPSGWFSWADVLDGWDKAQTADDPDAMRVFTNTVLGLPFEASEVEQTDWRPLYLRRGNHMRGWVPEQVAVLTAGADVQGDRLEVEVVGWGEGLRSWSIDYLTLHGDPTQPEVWAQLDELVERGWSGIAGAVYQVSRVAIDSGFSTQDVYQWAHRMGPRIAMPVKGSSYAMPVLVGAPEPVEIDLGGRKMRSGATVRRLNTWTLKDHIKRWVELAPSIEGGTPQRWCEWPDYPREYFEGLCSEQRVPKGSRVEWVTPTKHTRNEPFDCRVYALAAAISLGLDRWDDAQWARALRDVKTAGLEAGEVEQVIKKPQPRRHTDSQYLSR